MQINVCVQLAASSPASSFATCHDLPALFTGKHQHVQFTVTSCSLVGLRLGRQMQVWFIPLADKRGVCR